MYIGPYRLQSAAFDQSSDLRHSVDVYVGVQLGEQLGTVRGDRPAAPDCFVNRMRGGNLGAMIWYES